MSRHAAHFALTPAEVKIATALVVRHVYRGRWAVVPALEGVLLGVLGITILILGVTVFYQLRDGGGQAVPALVILGAIVLYWVFRQLRLRRWFRMSLSLPLGSGTEVALEAEGLSHTRGGVVTTLPWRAASDVRRKGGVIAVIFGTDVVAMPERAFPDPDALWHDTESWRAAR